VNRLVILALAKWSYKNDVLALPECNASIDNRYVEPLLVWYQSFNHSKAGFVCSLWQRCMTKDYDLVFADLVKIAFLLVSIARF